MLWKYFFFHKPWFFSQTVVSFHKPWFFSQPWFFFLQPWFLFTNRGFFSQTVVFSQPWRHWAQEHILIDFSPKSSFAQQPAHLGHGDGGVGTAKTLYNVVVLLGDGLCRALKHPPRGEQGVWFRRAHPFSFFCLGARKKTFLYQESKRPVTKEAEL